MELVTVHLGALVLTAIVILYSDYKGFQYFWGTIRILPVNFVTKSHQFVWAGLISMILSGVLLTLPGWQYYLADPAFLVKMGFVLVLVVNSFFIGKLSSLTTERAFYELPTNIQKSLLVSGALSATGWIGATITGFFLL